MLQLSPHTGERKMKEKDFLNWKIGVIIVTLIVVGAVIGYVLYQRELSAGSGNSGNRSTLVIYTYNSLFQYGANPNQTMNIVFKAFESMYNVNIVIDYPSAGLLSTLLTQKSKPQADIVIGLTNVEEPAAVSNGLLIPYNVSGDNNIPGWLTSDLSTHHYLTPYEYSYLSIDYMMNFYNETKGEIAHSNFQNFTNGTWAKNLIVENPTTSITGENFLIWQIAYYQYVLHQSNWESWWSSVKNKVTVEKGWSSAFNLFTTAGTPQQAVVSYATDPAYEMYNNSVYNATMQYNATLSENNGSIYGWNTIYGIGIVNGSKNINLDKAFINWFLSGTVQNQIPLNEWEYPANSTVHLPSVYRYAVNSDNVISLNNYMTRTEISVNLNTWLEDWQVTMS